MFSRLLRVESYTKQQRIFSSLKSSFGYPWNPFRGGCPAFVDKTRHSSGQCIIVCLQSLRNMETSTDKVPLVRAEVPRVSRNISVCTNEELTSTLSRKEDLPLPLRVDDRFRNPWSSWREKKTMDLLRFLFGTKDESNVPNSQVDIDEVLPVHRVDASFLARPLKTNTYRLTWLGHSSVLAQFDGFHILTDPVFSMRCSPFELFGPKRIRPVPCDMEDLPPLDVILISHSHYDHLDKHTLKKLLSYPKHQHAILVVPLGLKALLYHLGIQATIYELSWWEHIDIDQKLRVVFTPSQHWSRRTLWDTNRCLWGSFAVIGESVKFYFAGDTGYCPVFKTIGRHLGPFDCAAIPIGAYHPRWFMSPQHIDPVEAVKIHEDIQSQFSIGIHWGTFILTKEYFLEPPQLLREALLSRKQSLDHFRTLCHGESVIRSNQKKASQLS
eukprot:jgi/Galph1/1603/GphlegSOOS_G288.1